MKICIVHFRGYFGQGIPTYKSLNIDVLVNEFTNKKYDVECRCITEIANRYAESDTIYLIGSHQNEKIKSFYDDVCRIRLANSKCIPAINMILAHENKGIQAMLSDSLNLDMVAQCYNVVNSGDKVKLNKVHKFTSGSGSSGVFIPEINSNFKSNINKVFWKNISLKDILFFLKSSILKAMSQDNIAYYRSYYPIVTQDKVSSIGFDYKLLVFFDKIYILKRYVRKNDFRSSGSGNFEFVEVSNKLLDFAYKFRCKLGTPYISLDVMEDEQNNFHCIEFQAVHFGPYTQMQAPFYYYKKDNDWVKNKSEKTPLEVDIVYGVDKFIKSKASTFIQ